MKRLLILTIMLLFVKFLYFTDKPSPSKTSLDLFTIESVDNSNYAIIQPIADMLPDYQYTIADNTSTVSYNNVAILHKNNPKTNRFDYSKNKLLRHSLLSNIDLLNTNVFVTTLYTIEENYRNTVNNFVVKGVAALFNINSGQSP